MLQCRLDELVDHVGVELGPTPWRTVTQDDINLFGRVTDDEQWIHTDPVRAAGGPFGTTIAHGFLTLSLSSSILMQALEVTDAGSVINYGLNRVRFPAPVPVGARVRASGRLSTVDAVPGGSQAVIALTFDLNGGARPVCVAEFVVRYLH